jgi:hypothetical protein
MIIISGMPKEMVLHILTYMAKVRNMIQLNMIGLLLLKDMVVDSH